ncbi:MAG: aminotransferase [Desulfobacteraceae bacterium 4572_88]|nr:MAG: aminotransferase [Desulfobacteraceae bacterium 4572_88]
MDWNSIYDAFPVNQEMIWLNNCGTTPAGTHVVNAMSRFMEGYAKKGTFTDAATYTGVRDQIKMILSGLLNCASDELALIHNTAEGMNFISHGLRLEPGDEIILLENEYPSNVYPWLHWKEKGVRLQTTPMGESPEDFLEQLTRKISNKTKVMAISSVHWCTGMPFPLEQAGQLCRDHSIELVVDGAQGVGMRPIDLRSTGISCMAFSTWKWLTGPLGMGVLYIARDKLASLKPVFMGTESVVNDEEYLPYKSELKPTTDRYTCSTANFNDWVYFAAALAFLDKIGFETVRERIFELSGQLREGLRGAGFQLIADTFPSHSTGITVCEKPGTPSHEIVAYLRENRVVAAERLGRIRLAPHIYISPDQIDEVIRLLSGC